jgi:predicted N-formylglutamate amidohydrolase
MTSNESWSEVPLRGDPSLLLIADHASSHVPSDIDLAIAQDVLQQHVAVDIGVDPLGRSLCASLGCPGIFGAISRLVIDLNREIDSPGLVPASSDGHIIGGNVGLTTKQIEARADRFWKPYHGHIAEIIERDRPRLIISLHSFTPRLAKSDAPRPWQVGVLYNDDDRAARIGIPLLQAAGVVTGDNQPYSGKILNATMNRHAEANGIPYLGLEVRQDLIGTEDGVLDWCWILDPIIRTVSHELGG